LDACRRNSRDRYQSRARFPAVTADCTDKPERQLAVVRDYAGLMETLRSRVRALNTTLAAVDELAGLRGNYTSKLLAPVPIRAIGLSVSGRCCNHSAWRS
jgi:hypothetical protein